MADSRAVKQPRQDDFDRVTFTQPPRHTSTESQRPIDLLIPNRLAEEKAAQTAKVEPPLKPGNEEAAPKPTPSTAPAEEATEQEPPKEKISAMLPAAMVERLKDVAFWERLTVATLVEEGLEMVLEERERKHGGPYEKRVGELKTGRPVGIAKPRPQKVPGMKRGAAKR